MARRGWMVGGLAASIVTLATLSAHLLTVDGEPRRGHPADASEPERSDPPPDPTAAVEAQPPVELGGSAGALPELTPEMTARLRAIRDRVESRRDDVFAKVGDSATVSRAFLECFASDDVDLGQHGDLLPVVEFFRGGNAGGSSPFRRESLAAAVGWSTRQVLVGEPPPLLEEVRAISPRFAFVLSGGNDVEGREPRRYANRMLRVVDHLESRGVIPILGSMPPRADDEEADFWVRRYNAVSRAVAAGRELPYIDFHAELDALPRRGLAGDGVHPNVLIANRATHPCHLTEDGLAHGHNMRNLLALQTLARLKRTVLEDGPPTDPSTPSLGGDGSVEEPFQILSLPFSDLRDTSDAPSSVIDGYPGCGDATDESGPEYIYRLVLSTALTIRFWAYSRPGADVDLHLLGDSAEGASCIERADDELTAEVGPGTIHLVVDTFVPAEGDAQAGEFLLLIEPVN